MTRQAVWIAVALAAAGVLSAVWFLSNFEQVPVTPGDVTIVRDAMRDVSLPTWSEACEKTAKGCTDDWKKTVGAAVGVK